MPAAERRATEPRQLELAIGGMTSAACAARVELPAGRTPHDLIAAVESIGYRAELPRPAPPVERDGIRTRLVVSIVLSVPVIAVSMVPALQSLTGPGTRSPSPPPSSPTAAGPSTAPP
jgi:hypothetical protein